MIPHWYYELVRTIIPGPQSISYFIPLLSLITALLIPPALLSHNALAILFMPIIIGCTIHAWMAMGGPDVITTDTLWWSLFFLVFRDPRRSFKHVTYVNEDLAKRSHYKGRIKEEGYPQTGLFARAKWVFLLLSSRPLTSWKTGDFSHDARMRQPNVVRSRVSFVKSIFTTLGLALLVIMPVALTLQRHDSFYPPSASAGFFAAILAKVRGTPQKPYIVHLLQRHIPEALLRPLTLGAYLYSLMTVFFLPAYLIPVATNAVTGLPRDTWSPHTWPRPHFGPFSSILDTGLRGLWGTWWHQQMRHAVSEPGRWLADRVLGLERGSKTRYLLICISAFALSGATHMGLVPPEPRWSKSYTAWDLRLRIGCFFWVQPLGILAEMMILEPVLSWVRRTAANRRIPAVDRSVAIVVRTVRLIWVLVFMSFALNFLIVPFMELGYWSMWPPKLLPTWLRAYLDGTHSYRVARLIWREWSVY